MDKIIDYKNAYTGFCIYIRAITSCIENFRNIGNDQFFTYVELESAIKMSDCIIRQDGIDKEAQYEKAYKQLRSAVKDITDYVSERYRLSLDDSIFSIISCLVDLNLYNDWAISMYATEQGIKRDIYKTILKIFEK